MQRTGEEREEEDVDEVEHRRVRGQELRQLVPAVPSRGAVEEEEVDDPRPHRGQHLIDEEKEYDARGEERPQRRPRDRLRALGRRRRVPPETGAPSRAGDRGTRAARPWSPSSKCSVDPSRARRGMPRRPPTRNPTAKPDDDPWEALLHLPHVEQPARLSADEHEPDLERDREEHEEHRRHPAPSATRITHEAA